MGRVTLLSTFSVAGFSESVDANPVTVTKNPIATSPHNIRRFMSPPCAWVEKRSEKKVPDHSDRPISFAGVNSNK